MKENNICGKMSNWVKELLEMAEEDVWRLSEEMVWKPRAVHSKLVIQTCIMCKRFVWELGEMNASRSMQRIR